MTRTDFDAYCKSLKATTHVVQWGNASVWKIGGKIFAICSKWGDGEGTKIGFKCSELSYSILIEQPDIIPAPYLARAKWVQIETAEAMTDQDIRGYIDNAYASILGKLTKTTRKNLGLTGGLRI
ncbi:MAG: MmcQ/YjbR family DNA-binding protein [Alphaproteobacteria bacterium]